MPFFATLSDGVRPTDSTGNSARSRLAAFALGVVLGLPACSKNAEPSPGDMPASPTPRGSSVPSIVASAAPSGTSASSDAGYTAAANGSMQDNMGRTFQGRFRMQVRAHKQSTVIRYLSKADRSRIQIERPRAQHRNFDAIFEHDQALVLLNEKNAYYTQKIADLKVLPEAAAKIDIDKTSEQNVVAGIRCSVWRLSEGSTHITACVAGIPSQFDLDKFEALSGFDVPAWVEEVVHQEYMPLTATAKDANGGEIYTVETLEWAPGQIADAEIATPTNYRKLDAPPERPNTSPR